MCSKLYADGELAATPYETDKVLRHRELCMGLNVLYAKKNHAQHEQEIAEQKTCDEGASNAD